MINMTNDTEYQQIQYINKLHNKMQTPLSQVANVTTTASSGYNSPTNQMQTSPSNNSIKLKNTKSPSVNSLINYQLNNAKENEKVNSPRMSSGLIINLNKNLSLNYFFKASISLL